MMPARVWLERVREQKNDPDLIAEVLADSFEFVLLAGRTGIGKTNLALHLAYCLSTGTPFFGLACQRVVVGYLGFEGTPQKMASRLEKIGANFPDPGENLRFHLCPPFVLERNIKPFMELVRGCRVLILDPLRYFAGRNFHKPADAIAFLSILTNLLAKLEMAAILCHHIRKPNPLSLLEPGDLYEIKGATEYVDAATSVLLLERTRQGHRPGGGFAPVNADAVTLYFAKHRDAVGELLPINLTFNRDRLLFEAPLGLV